MEEERITFRISGSLSKACTENSSVYSPPTSRCLLNFEVLPLILSFYKDEKDLFQGLKDALAEALQKLIADPELRRRMGQAGREKSLREFALDRMLRETERVYEEVVGDGG